MLSGKIGSIGVPVGLCLAIGAVAIWQANIDSDVDDCLALARSLQAENDEMRLLIADLRASLEEIEELRRDD